MIRTRARYVQGCPYAKAHVEENCPVVHSTEMPIDTGTRFAASANSQPVQHAVEKVKTSGHHPRARRMPNIRVRNVSSCEHAKDYVNKHCRSVHSTKTVVETTTNVAVPVNIQSVLPVAGREKPCGLPIRRRETQCPCAKHVKKRRKKKKT